MVVDGGKRWPAVAGGVRIYPASGSKRCLGMLSVSDLKFAYRHRLPSFDTADARKTGSMVCVA